MTNQGKVWLGLGIGCGVLALVVMAWIAALAVLVTVGNEGTPQTVSTPAPASKPSRPPAEAGTRASPSVPKPEIPKPSRPPVDLIEPESLSVPELIQQLKSRSSVRRAKVAGELGEREALSAIPSLVELLGDEAGLQVIGGGATTVGEFAAVALAQMGRPGMAAIIERMKTLNDDRYTRGIADAFFVAGRPAIRRLGVAMVEGTPRLRANGIKVAARIFWYPSYYKGGPGTRYAPLLVDALIKSLADESNRAAAMALLADIRDPRVAPAVEPYVRDRDPRIRSLAARALETNKAMVTPRRRTPSTGAP